MSNTIDNRVVQLDLENASFERNAKKSVKTLDELDKALEFKNGKRGFEEVERAAEKTNFASLIAAAETVSTRLSALGVVGITALQNITNKAIDAGEKLVKALSVDQIMSGYSKYEQKTASVQTLVNATGDSVDKVNEYLEKLMWFSDETSYSFTDMTQALSTMVTSGGDINKLIPMIMGVANSVAFAGKGANEFSRVMYNLNQSYSAGALKYADWKSIELAGAASKELKQAFIETAVAQGKITKGAVDIANFSETLKSGWLDTSVMEKTFGDMAEITQKAYEMVQSGQVETASEAYEILSKDYDSVAMRAALAAQQAKTLTEAIDSVKDAVSTGWMTTFETIFGDYSQASKLWTTLAEDLWDIFASGGKKRNAVLADVFDSGFQKIQKAAAKAGISVDDLHDAMLDVAEAKGVDLGDAISEYGNLDSAIRNVEGGADIVKEALAKLAGTAKASVNATSDQFSAYKQFVSEYAWGGLGNEATAMKKAADAGLEWEVVLAGLDAVGADLNAHNMNHLLTMEEYENILKTTGVSTEELTDLSKELADSNSDLNKSFSDFNKRNGTEVIGSALHSLLTTVINLKETVGNAWENVFGTVDGGAIFKVIERVESFAIRLEGMTTDNRKLQLAFESVFSILKGITSIGGSVFGVFGSIFRLIGRIASYVGKLEPVANVIQRIKEIVFGNIHSAPNLLENIASRIDDISRFIDGLDPSKIPFISKAIGVMGSGFRKVSKFATKAYSAIQPMIPILVDGLSHVAKYLINDTFLPFGRFVSDLISSEHPIETLRNGLKSAWTWLKKLYTDGSNFVKNVLSKFGIDIDFGDSEGTLSGIMELLGGLREKITSIAENTDLGTVIAGIAAVGTFVSIMRLSDAFTQLGDAAGSIKSVFNNVNKLFKKNLGSSFADNVKKIAAAITSLAFAVVLMALIPTGKLWSAVGAVAVLVLVMSALTGALMLASKYISKKDNKSLTTLAKTMVGMAISIMLIAVAGEKLIKAFSGIEGFGNQMGVMFTSFLYLLGMAGILVGMAFIMNMLKGKIAIGAAVMIFLAVAILAFAKAVGLLNKVDLGSSLGTIVMLVVELTAIAIIFKTLGSKSAGSIVKFAVAVLAIVAAFGIAIYAIQKLCDMAENIKFSEKAIWILVGVIVGLAVVGAVCALVSKYLDPAIKTAAMIGVAILALVGAIFLLELLVERIAKLNNPNIGEAGSTLFMIAISLAIVMAAFAAIAWATDNGKGVFKIAASLLVVIAGFALLVGVFAILSKFVRTASPTDIWKAIGIIFGLGLIIAGMSIALGYAAKLSDGSKSIGIIISVLLGLIVVFGLFAAALLIVKTNDGWAILKALGVLIVIAAAVSLSALAIGKAGELAGEGIGGAAKILGMMLVIGTVGAVLFYLSNQPWASLAIACVAILAVLATIVGAFYLMEKAEIQTGTVVKLLAGMVILAGVVWLMSVVVSNVVALPVEGFFTKVATFFGAIIIFALVVGALALIGQSAISLPFLAISAGILLLSASAWVFAEAMNTLQNANLGSVADGLWSLSEAFVASLLATIGIGLFGVAAIIAAPGIMLLTDAITGLVGILAVIGNAWEAGGGTLLGTLSHLGPAFEETAAQMSAGTSVMSNGLSNATTDIESAGEDMSNAASEAVSEAADAVTETAPEVVEAVETTVEEAGEAAAASTEQEMGKLRSMMSGGGFGFGDILSTLTGGEGGMFDLSSLFSGFDASGLTEMLGSAFSGIDMGAIGANLDFSSMFDSGNIDFSSFTSTFQGGLGTSIADVDVSSSAATLMENMSSSLYENASSADVQSSLTEVGTIIGDSVLGGMKDVDASGTGSFFVEGFAKGVRLATYIAEEAARYMAKKSKEAADAELKVQSPSREMMETGKFFVLGFANGVSDNIRTAMDNAALMAKSAMKAVDNVMVHEDYDGIVPVLDMRDVYSGLSNLDDIWRPTIRPTLDMRDVNPGLLNARAIAGQMSINESKAIANPQGFNDSRIIGEISALREQMVNRPIGETALYINGRKMASTIAGDMNRELNVLARRG